MAVYFVTGKLGSGKSLVAVGKIRDYLSEGRRVATNLDLWLDEMFTYHDQPAIRLPDKPLLSWCRSSRSEFGTKPLTRTVRPGWVLAPDGQGQMDARHARRCPDRQVPIPLPTEPKRDSC
ncbi:zonular occludens toxin domain-containing protein [Pseudomonas anguilliseptica]|uniref:Zonular occludens toxin (Zot) n=1 Tax=Pseudomonas anguilliseptica TaxID=53406 RepID=A0A1H5LR72_PSEAG|nr:zonular occludens toxin domain-containing protein [Pseudomonas anguilliseptica]SEE79563.1 Zonular occludens toxin (Zot) [Pseudomonas anguilliseptica]